MKKIFVVIIISFILGLLVMYAWEERRIGAINHAAGRIVDNCQNSLQTYNDLLKNCSAAYLVTTKCIANLEVCDIPNAKRQLQNLETEKENLLIKQAGVATAAGQIFEEARIILQK